MNYEKMTYMQKACESDDDLFCLDNEYRLEMVRRITAISGKMDFESQELWSQMYERFVIEKKRMCRIVELIEDGTLKLPLTISLRLS